MKWFLVLYIFQCTSAVETDLSKCPSQLNLLKMPSKEICEQIKNMNSTLFECWAKEDHK